MEGEFKNRKPAPGPLEEQPLSSGGAALMQDGRFLGQVAAPKSESGGELEVIDQDGAKFYRTGDGAFRPLPGQSEKPMDPTELMLYTSTLRQNGFSPDEIKAEVRRVTQRGNKPAEGAPANAPNSADPAAAKKAVLDKLGL